MRKTLAVENVILEARYFNAPADTKTLPCRSITECEPVYSHRRSADGTIEPSLIVPLCFFLNGVTHQEIDALGWEPNRFYFKDARTGEMKDFIVARRDTLEPVPQFAVQ